MDLTLNVFREVLGKVNDGNVVFTQEDGQNTGIKKVNYGRLFTKEATPSDPAVNREIRLAFFNAVSHSVEGRRAGDVFINNLRARLGLGDEPQSTAPLSRREIKQVFDDLGKVGGSDIGLISSEMSALKSAGLLKQDTAMSIRQLLMPSQDTCMELFRDNESMQAAFGKKEAFNGYDRGKLDKFLKDNCARLKMMAFDRLYWTQVDAEKAEQNGLNVCRKPLDAAQDPAYQRNLLRSLVDALMGVYGRHEEFSTRALDFVKCPPVAPTQQPVEGMEQAVDGVNALLTAIFPNQDDVLFDRVQNNTLRNAASNAFANAFRGVAGQQLGSLADRLASVGRDFSVQHPDMAKLLDLPLGELGKLGAWDLKALGERLRGAVLAELRTVSEDHPVNAEDVLKAVVTAARILQDVKPDNLTLTLLKATNENDRTNLSDEQLKALVGNCRDLADGENFKAIQKKALENIARGLPADTGLSEAEGFFTLRDSLSGKIRDSIEGPEKRRQMFEAIGKTTDALYTLPPSMRVPDPVNGLGAQKQKPIDDAAAMIGAKCAFLKTVLGSIQHPDLAGILGRDGTFITGTVDGTTQEERLRKLDLLVNRFTSVDISDTKAYLESGISGGDGDGTFYKLCRDKHFSMSDVSPKGCESFTQLKMGGMQIAHYNIASLVDASEDAATLKGFYDMLVACLKECADETFSPPPYSPATVKDTVKSLLTTVAYSHGNALFGPSNTLQTSSSQEVIAALLDFGVKIKDIDTLAGAAKLLLLMRARHVHGNSFAGIAEWAERLSGVDPRTATIGQLATLATAVEKADKGEKALKDPFETTALSAEARQTVAFLGGRLKVEEFALDAPSMNSLLAATRKLSASGGSAMCTIGATTVKLSVRPNGVLAGRVTVGGRDLPVAMNCSAADLKAVLETRVANHPDEYAELAPSVLPTLENGLPTNYSVSRARELCVKVLTAKLGAPSVAFAAMGLADLVAAARGALAGTYTRENVPTAASTVYNSAEVAMMQQAYVDARDEVKALVKLPTATGVRTLAERQTTKPTAATVHVLVSELVMNLDTTVYDRDAGKEKGTRLKTVVDAYAPELAFIREDIDAYLETLPDAVRGGVKAILEKIFAVNGDDLAAFATIETDIGNFVAATMDDMQAKIAQLFAKPVEGPAEGEAWTRSLEELANVNGLDPKSPNGKFVLDVLKNYFSRAADTEKRAMLSAYLRNTFMQTLPNGDKADPSIGVQAGELMKGAGPVFQKMLQGLPIESFGEETRAALKDMKSRLSPIPDPVIRAQLLNLIQSSNGNILSIEVKKSIGCATVGQALLCHIITKEHPYTGEDVVIKLLRPNVQTAAQREYELISQIAQESGGPGMVDTFKGQFQTILRELDFTLEAENIDVGKAHYDKPRLGNEDALQDVRSMGRFLASPPATNALVLEKVSGDTLDGTLTKCADKIKAIKARFEHKVALNETGEEMRTVLQGKSLGDVQQVRLEMRQQVADLNDQRKKLEHLLQAWTNEALFGSGFFHGDMHAGNIMSDDNTMTFIDFGNATRLSEAEQLALAKLFVTAGYNNQVDNPAAGFVTVLKDLLDEKGKAALDAESRAIKSELAEVMKLATSEKLASKVFAALAVVQRHKVPLPGGLNAFMQSLSRLKGAMSQIDDLIEASETVFQGIEHGPNVVSSLGLEEFRGRLPLIDEFIEVITNGGRNAEKSSPDQLQGEAYGKLKAFADQARVQRASLTGFPGEEYADLKPFGESGEDLSLFEALADRLKDVAFTSSSDSPAKPVSDVTNLKVHIQEVKELLAKPDKTDDDVKTLAKKKALIIVSAYAALVTIARETGECLPPKRVDHDDFEAVIAGCLSRNLDVIEKRLGLMELTSFAYGSVLVDSHVREQRELAAKAAIAADNAADEQNRIGAFRQRKLLRVLAEFRVPNGPTSNAELSAEQAKKALAVNLQAARKRLGYTEGERMTDGELAFMATYLKNLRQVCDTRNKIARGLALTIAVAQMRNGTAPTKAYTIDVQALTPVMRGVQALRQDEIPDDGSELARLVALLRAE